MNEDVYIRLLYKRISDHLAQNEEKELEEWLSASEKNRETARQVELAWNESGKLKFQPKVDLDAAFTELEKRIEQEEKPAVKTRVFNFRRILSIAAGIAILAVSGLLLRPYLFQKNEMEWVELKTENEPQLLSLSDGSTIHLNAHSILKYPKEFLGNERKVSLSGEAYFEIAKDSKHPFVLEAGLTEIKVLGTKFNVFAQKEGSEVRVLVTEGKVSFGKKGIAKKVILEANEEGIFSNQGEVLEKPIQAQKNNIAWHTKRLEFVDAPIAEVLTRVEKLYQVQIVVLEPNLERCLFTSTFEDLKLDAVMEIIEGVLAAEVVQKDENVFEIIGGTCE